MTLLLSRTYLTRVAGWEVGSGGFSSSSHRTMTIAVNRVAASGQWESMSMNLAKWGSLPPVVAARIGCSPASW
jgi:hypothetical protein